MTAQTKPQTQQAPNDDPFSDIPKKAEPTYPVPVDGQTLDLTLPQLIDAAAAGLSARSRDARLDHAADGMDDGMVYADFLREYPDIPPEDIPEQVWLDAERCGSLVSAFRKWENQQLKVQLAILQKNADNRARAIGPAVGEGEPQGFDPVEQALLG